MDLQGLLGKEQETKMAEIDPEVGYHTGDLSSKRIALNGLSQKQKINFFNKCKHLSKVSEHRGSS